MNRSEIEVVLEKQKNKPDLFERIVNIPFINRLRSTQLSLGIVVLLLVNEEESTLDRIALSETELARGAVNISPKPFHDIRIPMDYEKNILVKAVKTKKFQQTADWKHMFIPELSPQDARLNQAGAGIGCSIVYPLVPSAGGNVLGSIIFSYYEPLHIISKQHHKYMAEYVTQVADVLSRKLKVLP